MGRLSEYMWTHGASGGNTVEVTGVAENQEMLGHLLTYEPGFDREFRKVIKTLLREARNNLSKDAKNYLKSDPRKAARAVKYSVYKTLFGGNISILSKRRAGAKYELQRERKLRPGQWGGNRRQRSKRTEDIDTYFGADRGFILRFLNAGTSERMTRYGNRGSIPSTGWFEHTAPWQMEAAASKLAAEIESYITKQANG